MAIRMKSTHALTDKGNIKNDVRKAIAHYVATHQDTIFAKAEKVGDKNVYFIDGKELMALCKDNGTVDNTHPTDFGFNSMARAVMKLMRRRSAGR